MSTNGTQTELGHLRDAIIAITRLIYAALALVGAVWASIVTLGIESHDECFERAKGLYPPGHPLLKLPPQHLTVALLSTFEALEIMHRRCFAGGEEYTQTLNLLMGPPPAGVIGLNGTTGLSNCLPAFIGSQKRWAGKANGWLGKLVTLGDIVERQASETNETALPAATGKDDAHDQRQRRSCLARLPRHALLQSESAPSRDWNLQKKSSSHTTFSGRAPRLRRRCTSLRSSSRSSTSGRGHVVRTPHTVLYSWLLRATRRRRARRCASLTSLVGLHEGRQRSETPSSSTSSPRCARVCTLAVRGTLGTEERFKTSSSGPLLARSKMTSSSSSFETLASWR